MNTGTLKKFLTENPLSNTFYYHIGDEYFEVTGRNEYNKFVFKIEIKHIDSIGVNYREVFIETRFGRYSFFRKDLIEDLRETYSLL